MRAMMGLDNDACLEWLDDALSQASEQGFPRLSAYLAVVREDVLFETERQGSGANNGK